MLQIGRDLNLSLEAIDADDRAQIRAQHLERDAAMVAEIASEIDLGHATFADQPFDGIAIGECGGERVSGEHGSTEPQPMMLEFGSGRSAHQAIDECHVEERHRIQTAKRWLGR